MDSEQLLSIVEQLKLDIRMQYAAILIQKNFRAFQKRKAFQMYLEVRQLSALKI
jgi:hypothetical protein